MSIGFTWICYILAAALAAAIGGNTVLVLEGKWGGRPGKGIESWIGGCLGTVIFQAYLIMRHTDEPGYLLWNALITCAFFVVINAVTRLVGKGSQTAEKIEAVPQQKENDQDLEQDSDYIEARRTVARLEAAMVGAEWQDAWRLVGELIDDRLPDLIRLRSNLAAEERELKEQTERAHTLVLSGRGVDADKRYATLRASHDQILAAAAQVTERIDATKGTLVQLLVIACERQLNGTSEAAGNADRLLADTREANENLLRVSRELSALGTRSS